MSFFKVRFSALLLLALVPPLWPAYACAAQNEEPDSALAAPLPDRISGAIDDDRRVVLRGNRHPLAIAANDVGRVSGDFRMERMILTLKPGAAQQAA